MELGELLTSLLRRWYVLVLGLAITAGLGLAVYENTTPEYETTGSVLLLPPDDKDSKILNPLLDLHSLEQPATFVSALLDTDEAQKAFSTEFPNSERTIGLDPQVAGPVITVTVVSRDPAESRAATTHELEMVQTTLADIQVQFDVPKEALVASAVLRAASTPDMLRMRQTRAVLVVLAGGGLLSLFLTTIIDASLARDRDSRPRKGRRAAQAAGSGSRDDAQGPAPRQHGGASEVHDAEPARSGAIVEAPSDHRS